MNAVSSQPAPWTVVGSQRSTSMPVRLSRVTAAVIGALVIGNLGRIPLLSTGARDAALLLNDVLVVGLVFIGFVAAVDARSLRLDIVGGLGLLFAFVGLTSALVAAQQYSLSITELAVSLTYLARWLVYFAVYLTLANSLARDDVASVWRALERTVLAFAAFGIFQSIFLPGFAQIIYPESRVYADWDPQGHRLVSTLLDPNFAGGLVMMVLLVELAQLASGASLARWKPMVLFAAVVMTASRSSLLALFVGGALIIAVRGVSRRLLQLGGVAVVLLAASAPVLIDFARKFNKLTVDASALQRVVQWARGLRVFADHPFIGIGFNTWGYVSERYGYTRLFASSYAIDGGLLFIAVMTGVVGLGLYLAMAFFVARRSRRIWRDVAQSPETRGLALGVTAATVALCVHSLFTNSLLLPILMEVLWVLWALVFVVSRPSTSVAA